MVNHSQGQYTPINYPDSDVDGDCEGDSMGVGDGASGTEKGEELTRAVLTTGLFST